MTNPASARHERLTALFQQTYALFLWKTNPTTECETALEPFFMKPTLLLGESAPMPALPEITQQAIIQPLLISFTIRCET